MATCTWEHTERNCSSSITLSPERNPRMAVHRPGHTGRSPAWGHADAAPPADSGPPLYGEAVAQQAHHVQALSSRRPASQAVPSPGPQRPRSAGRGVLPRLTGADGDGPAERPGMSALDVDELPRGPEGGPDHVPAPPE